MRFNPKDLTAEIAENAEIDLKYCLYGCKVGQASCLYEMFTNDRYDACPTCYNKNLGF